MSNPKPIILFALSSRGGLAEHIHYQAMEMHRIGLPVTVIAKRSYLDDRPVPYSVKRYLLEEGANTRYRLLRKVSMVISLLYNQHFLAAYAILKRPSFILLDSYMEYFSPFWFWGHLISRRFFGVKYIANIHDPVRDYVVGYEWWHRLSVRLAYLPIHFGLVHRKLPQPSPIPVHVKLAEVPVGVYDAERSEEAPDFIRNRWGFPANGRIFLSFGYIRDNKNIDLFLQAQRRFENVYLVVLGTVANASAKPMSYYRQLVKELGVTERVFLSEEFIPDAWIYSIFRAADFILLTYSRSFVSQSGVLNIAADVRKRVLASSGPSPMQDAVESFNLGVFVEPDSEEAIKEGISRLISDDKAGNWDGYLEYASWETNIQKMLTLVDYKKEKFV